VETAKRLAGRRLDKETEGIDEQRLIEHWLKEIQESGVDPILTFAVGHAGGEGEMESELFKDVGIPPEFKIFLLLTAELCRLAPSEFAGIERGAKSIKGAGAQ